MITLARPAPGLPQRHARAHLCACTDKACLKQRESIEEQLAYLPVFLSGCQCLVVLAGQTYTERVWCVMEMFSAWRAPDRTLSGRTKPHGCASMTR